MINTTIQHPDGRVELTEEGLRDIVSSPLYNVDLAPVPVPARNWTTYNYAAFGYRWRIAYRPT